MIEVVGVEDGGWAWLPAHLQQLVREAPVVIGGRRHLDMLPSIDGQERRTWPRPLREGLRRIVDGVNDSGVHADESVKESPVVVLASGDPLRSGIGTSLVETFGAEQVRVHPALSSETLARARMRWSAEDVDVVTTVGRSLERVRPLVAPGARLVVLGSDATTPRDLAALLVQWGASEAVMTAWWHLGGPQEGSLRAVAAQWDARERTLAHPMPDLVLVCVEVPESLSAADVVGTVPGRSETHFGNDGLITKRDVRAAALARLRPTRGALLWDLGAGSGAVGIEWALAATGARTVAVERDPERAQRVRDNATALGVAHLVDIVEADVEAFVATQGGGAESGSNLAASNHPPTQAPDAVFVGGGVSDEVLARAVDAVRPGGRVVAHAVTLESESVLLDAWRTHGGDLTRLSVEHLEPLGRLHGWRPARAVVQWSYDKDAS